MCSVRFHSFIVKRKRAALVKIQAMRAISRISWPLPSPRLAIYCALLSLLWIAAAFLREFIVLALMGNLLLFFVAAMDLLLSPSTSDFEISRILDDKLNLGTPNTIALEVHNHTNLKMSLTVRDEPPAEWPVAVKGTTPLPSVAMAVARGEIEVSPHGHARFEYSTTPTRRGVWIWGAASLRFQTRLGFWFRQKRFAPDKYEQMLVRVYPDVSEVKRYELLLRMGRLRDIGLHLQRLRGQGSEFESLREYARGDDYRDINWKASARRGKLIATDYEIERDQSIIIAIDCGRMMTSMAHARERVLVSSDNSYHSATQTPLSKLDWAINAAVLLSHVSASTGDAVGVLLFADGVLKFLPPRKGRVQTGAIIEVLYAIQPRLVEPDYNNAYQFLMSRKLRRALVVTFTDLIDAEASRELIQASGTLRRHHNALCVTINNRDVTEMAQHLPQTSDEIYSKAMAQRMLTQRAGALENLRQRGVGVLDVEAEQLSVATVNKYLEMKARGAL